jgi:hypothetical protein
VSEGSVLGKTSQRWKLLLAVLALLVGSIAPAFPVSGLSWTMGTVVALAGYGLGLMFIRCPACGSRWLWDALMNAGVYKAILTRPECPSCHQLVSTTKD